MTRILFVTHTPPWPTVDGGAQRSNLLLRALCGCGEVDLLLVRRPGRVRSDALPRLRRDFGLVAAPRPWARGRFWPWRMVRRLHPAFVDKWAWILGAARVEYDADPNVSAVVRRQLRMRRYDLIVGRYLQPTAHSGALRYRPVVVDVDDLDTEAYRLRLHGPGYTWRERLVYGNHSRKLRTIVPDRLRRCDRLWVCSEADRRRLGPDRSTVLPNIPFQFVGESSMPSVSPPTGPARILIVGSLRYHVNVRAVDHFLDRVWPAIRAACPAAVLRIVGTGLTPGQRDRWAAVDGAEPVGFVEELADEYAKATFTIAPVSDGGGTKIKVLEALYHGRTCVVTPHVARGFASVLRDGHSIRVAENDAAFADACIALIRNASLRERLARDGRRMVVRHYTFEAFRRIVESTVERLLPLGPVAVASGDGRP